MTVSKKQQASVHKYVREHYDRISLTVPHGKKEQLRLHAESQGESLNAFMNRAADETMLRDKEKQADRRDPAGHFYFDAVAEKLIV